MKVPVTVTDSGAGVLVEFPMSSCFVRVERLQQIVRCNCGSVTLDVNMAASVRYRRTSWSTADVEFPWAFSGAATVVGARVGGVPWMTPWIELPECAFVMSGRGLSTTVSVSGRPVCKLDARQQLIDLGGVTPRDALLITAMALEEQFLAATPIAAGVLSTLLFADGFERSLTISPALSDLYTARRRLRRKRVNRQHVADH
jgi:hypothetical protein